MTEVLVGSWYADVASPDTSLRIEYVNPTSFNVQVSAWLLTMTETRMLSTVDLTVPQIIEYVESGQWVLAATPVE